MNGFKIVGFETWQQVLAHVEAKLPLFYKAPLDHIKVRVAVTKQYKNGTIRIRPSSWRTGSFQIDAGHLDRLWRIQP